MNRFARLLAAFAATLLALAAHAEDDRANRALLIQIEAGGKYRIWYNQGETQLTEDEIALLEMSAEAEGGKPVLTAQGAARAFQREGYLMVSVPKAAADSLLLVAGDPCSGTRIWHSAGTTDLTEAQLTDLVAAAVPGGGERVRLGDRYAKAFLTKIGVVAVIWASSPPRR